jgi:drug/metabolite transporter (DMT)-like permease
MPIAEALVAMCAWGFSDYLAALAARQTDSKIFSFYFQMLSLPLILPVAIAATLTLGGRPQPIDVGIGLVWGLDSAFITTTLLFRAMATGRISVVAPLAGVTMAVVPVLFSVFAFKENVGGLSWIGIGVGTLAIALLSLGPASSESRLGRITFLGVGHDVELGLICGLGLAFCLIIVDRTSAHAYLWPLFVARLTAGTVLYGICRRSRLQIRVPRQSWVSWLPVFALDALGNGIFFFASHSGVLAIVAVIVGLAPAVVTLLAISTPTNGPEGCMRPAWQPPWSESS